MLTRTTTNLLNAAKPLFFNRHIQQPIVHSKKQLFSAEVWKKAQPCMQAILNSSFIEKLKEGSLDEAVFAHFLVQDQAYLRAYKTANLLIAKRLPVQFQHLIKGNMHSTATLEQQAIEHLQKQLKLQIHGQITPATQAYVEELLYSASYEPVELAFALKLPCDLVFNSAAHHIASHTTVPNNKYKPWYSTYITEQFRLSRQRKLTIFDCLANQQTPEIRKKMCAKFLEGMQLECDFFDSLYTNKSENMKIAHGR